MGTHRVPKQHKLYPRYNNGCRLSFLTQTPNLQLVWLHCSKKRGIV